MLHTQVKAGPKKKIVYSFCRNLRYKDQISVKEQGSFGRKFRDVLTPIHVLSDRHTLIFCSRLVYAVNNQKGLKNIYLVNFNLIFPYFSAD